MRDPGLVTLGRWDTMLAPWTVVVEKRLEAPPMETRKRILTTLGAVALILGIAAAAFLAGGARGGFAPPPAPPAMAPPSGMGPGGPGGLPALPAGGTGAAMPPGAFGAPGGTARLGD